MVKSRQELPLRRYSFVAGVGLVGLSLAACGASPGSTGAAITGHPWVLSKQYAGQTITVLLPPWGQMPASQLAKFTAKTGIKVRMENLAWDSIHDKVVTAEAAGTAPADVTEVDWSWVGQFSQAGWYTNLSSLIQPSVLKDNIVAKVFHVNGEQVALPYNMDFRATMINWTDFKKAGITTPPRTLLSTSRQLQIGGYVRLQHAAIDGMGPR